MKRIAAVIAAVSLTAIGIAGAAAPAFAKSSSTSSLDKR
jgi:hypothetical protein